jgi:hypothetical protein
MENSTEAPQTLTIKLPYDTEILLLCIYQKKCKSGYNKAKYRNSEHASLLMNGLRKCGIYI